MGSGHVMRCLALADGVRLHGANATFICRHLSEPLEAELGRRGHSLIRLTRPLERDPTLAGYENWLGVSRIQDAAETRAALLASGPYDWLIYDHYALDADWSNVAKTAGMAVLAIDDLGDREHNCDILLDQNVMDDDAAATARYRRLIPGGCRLLLGPRYALVRREFVAARKTLAARDGTIRQVLVSLGAFSAQYDVPKILEGLARTSALDGVTVHVLGESGVSLMQVPALDVRLHGFTADSASLMVGSDLAIGTPGSSAWERCCLALPTVVVVVAENQVPVAERLERSGCAVNLGWLASLTIRDVTAALSQLASAPGKLRAMAACGAALVDGRGVERVARDMAIAH
jgi:UDP-2,4-diacetamido-2,4,6-trideoxy-beta-L-altropyranose hydrolase